MLTLDQLQHGMCAAIRGGREPELLRLIDNGGIQPEARLRIYRNHAILSLTETLKATFPVVCQLVDERFFCYAAHEYIREVLPSRPCLAEYGESFPNFLATFPACCDLVYLADVARLEWAINLALHAAEAEPADRSALARPDFNLTLHPSLRLVSSQWPIEHIWRANQPEADPETVISLDSGAARLMVYRRSDRVVIRGLEERTYAFLDAILEGEAPIEAAPIFDRAADLNLLLEEGLIVRPAPASARL
ncbi:MAG: DNA-binding domain-containing protein [Stellaceae bacterium]